MEALTTAQVVARLAAAGRPITTSTWHAYVSRGQAPKPDPRDAVDGRTPRWTTAAVDQWLASRPDRSARSLNEDRYDLHVNNWLHWWVCKGCGRRSGSYTTEHGARASAERHVQDCAIPLP
jgi:predicted DNA-binding transcriptional regulator AlpA